MHLVCLLFPFDFISEDMLWPNNYDNSNSNFTCKDGMQPVVFSLLVHRAYSNVCNKKKICVYGALLGGNCDGC